MSTLDEELRGVTVHTKGALESLLPCRSRLLDEAGRPSPLTPPRRRQLGEALDAYAARGLRVLAVAGRELVAGEEVPVTREQAETDLVLLGLVAMVDPLRDGVADAVARAHRAGLRMHVITGDYGPTAAEIARQVGIGYGGCLIVTGAELDRLSDPRLDDLLGGEEEIVFARTWPGAKLRICEAPHARGHVAVMTA
jgi:magnesium-transporting ATPase (P-type)